MADADASPHSSQITDDQEHKLLAVHHGPAYERALAVKKAADADFKNVCKRAKAEGIAVADIKLWIELKSPEGEERLKADMERRLQIARWSGMTIGEQAELFPAVDRTPLAERARAAGKRAGIEGAGSGDNPHDVNIEAGREWEAGRQEGMAVQIVRGIKPTADTDQPEDEGAGETDDPTVDADLPHDEQWKARNAMLAGDTPPALNS